MNNKPCAAVIGWPIEHSRSPIIHRHWLRQYHINGDYKRIAVSPEDIVPFLENFTTHDLVGINVTIPHKETAFDSMNHIGYLDEAAKALGAVNTIWLRDNKLYGSNTDSYGFLSNLDQLRPRWDANPRAALVIGAGGAARSVVHALCQRHYEPIYIANRTYERAEAIARLLGGKIHPINIDEIADYLPKTSLLVNASSLGMTGQAPLNIDLTPLPHDALVSDIVYAPLEAELLKNARLRGNPTVGGLGMLLHQAVPGFEKWFGTKPIVTDALRQDVLSDIGTSS